MAAETAAFSAFFALLITMVASQTPPTAYTNHTVGGPAGWFFNATNNISTTNYSSWAASQTFNLGDFLIFRTNSNQTVIQTYNLTTFNSCSFDDASDNDTVQYYGGDSNFNKPLVIPVPLTIKGPNYFFSDADDGVQCQRGMAFEIQVNTGLGLPPSLNQPPPPPYATPPDSESSQTPPFTIPETKKNGGFKSVANLRRDLFFFFFMAMMPLLPSFR
ncbi:cucumber peeling cupredoxin-like [Cucumis melo var. makuwa]|uniref:Cucumber peeling cupredoxin-like n=1 Tax=Cucumis melo var. makuwa TaxID=1194695 RepID=A0A5A7TAL9_CUCMM|nr:cucumber peeling cupredoxin-like [Cucumis melo var. makuwa]TYK24494.1 cucumber peeling cupredoxin-like [Cucumis melo var. makuwa]